MAEPLADRKHVDLLHRNFFLNGEVVEKLRQVRGVVA